jgi:molybdopterin-guanine dinucleotide biosynthesis protein A
MQRDKATLRYHGRTQLEWAMSFIEPHVAKAFVSVRADQQNDPTRSQFALIADTREGKLSGRSVARDRL